MKGPCKTPGCASHAINPHRHGRKPDVDLDLCDVCYWRKRAIDWRKWPDKKPGEDGGYLFVDSWYNKGKSTFFACLDTSNYENGRWDGDIEPAYWAEIPRPEGGER